MLRGRAWRPGVEREDDWDEDSWKPDARDLGDGWGLGSCSSALLGCSGYRSYREAEIAERHGDWDKAVLHYLELVDQYPSNISYKAGLLRSKIKASQGHFDRAKKLHEAGALQQARREYLQTLQLDPSNQYAQVEYEKVVDRVGAGRWRHRLSVDRSAQGARPERGRRAARSVPAVDRADLAQLSQQGQPARTSTVRSARPSASTFSSTRSCATSSNGDRARGRDRAGSARVRHARGRALLQGVEREHDHRDRGHDAESASL